MNGFRDIQEPDTQIEWQMRNKPVVAPEQRLMMAVLTCAVEDFQKYATATKVSDKRLFRSAEDWIFLKDPPWEYSFDVVCEYLNLNPDYIRKGLILWLSKFKEDLAENKPRPFKKQNRYVV